MLDNEQARQRNASYDFLRFIGISAIIGAHMNLPPLLFQLRNFDVPLMIFMAGISYSEFSSTRRTSYFGYMVSRFNRIILPTWIILVLYNFIAFMLYGRIPDMKGAISQIALWGGTEVGIWFVRTLAIIALIAPLYERVNKKTRKQVLFYILLIIMYVSYEILIRVIFKYRATINMKAAFNIAAPILAYGSVFFYGLRARFFGKLAIIIHTIIALFIYLIYVLIYYRATGQIVQTQLFKYPPQIYYFSYGMFVTLFLYYLIRFGNLRIVNFGLFRFIGRSTLWIYLWHYIFFLILQYMNFSSNVLLIYSLAYTLVVMTVYFQTTAVLCFTSRIPMKDKQKKFIRTVFTG